MRKKELLSAKNLFISIFYLVLLCGLIKLSFIYIDYIKDNSVEELKTKFENKADLIFNDFDKNKEKIVKNQDNLYYCVLEYFHYKINNAYDDECIKFSVNKHKNKHTYAMLVNDSQDYEVKEVKEIKKSEKNIYFKNETLKELIKGNIETIKETELLLINLEDSYSKRNPYLLNSELLIFLKKSTESFKLKELHDYFSDYNFFTFSILLIPLFFIKKVSFIIKLMVLFGFIIVFKFGQIELSLAILFVFMFFLKNFLILDLKINAKRIYCKQLIHVKTFIFLCFLWGNINFGYLTSINIENSISLGLDVEVLNIFLILLLILNYFIFQILVSVFEYTILMIEKYHKSFLNKNNFLDRFDKKFFKNINNLNGELGEENIKEYIEHFYKITYQDKVLVRNYIVDFLINENTVKIRSVDNCFFIFINLVFLNSQINDDFDNFYDTIFSNKKISHSHWQKYINYLSEHKMEHTEKLLNSEYNLFKYKKNKK